MSDEPMKRVDPDLYIAYVDDAFAKMLESAAAAGDQLNDRPLGDSTNSIGALVMHCCEVCEFWLGHIALGRDSKRDRDAEFVHVATLGELEERVARARAVAAEDLRTLSEVDGAPSELRQFATGGESDASVAMYVLKELHQHLGHIEVTLDALRADEAAHDDERADPIHHLAVLAEWERVARTGAPYARSTIDASLDEVGFVHCSFGEQVQATADRYYSGRSDVVLLTIDPALLDVELRVENTSGGAELFPHVYGPIPIAAIVGVVPVELGPDGRLDLASVLQP